MAAEEETGNMAPFQTYWKGRNTLSVDRLISMQMSDSAFVIEARINWSVFQE